MFAEDDEKLVAERIQLRKELDDLGEEMSFVAKLPTFAPEFVSLGEKAWSRLKQRLFSRYKEIGTKAYGPLPTAPRADARTLLEAALRASEKFGRKHDRQVLAMRERIVLLGRRAEAAEDAIERILDLDQCEGVCCLGDKADQSAAHDAALTAIHAVYGEIKKRKVATDG